MIISKIDKKKISKRRQHNWTNIFLQSQGGDINIAKLITRLDSDTGPALSEWLRSIPHHPKAFKLKMRPLVDILNFKVQSLFANRLYEDGLVICKKSPTKQCVHGTTIDEFQLNFNKRRDSLDIAIEIFRHKNVLQFNDLEIEAGSPDKCLLTAHGKKSNLFPTYKKILEGIDFKVVMELDGDYCKFVLSSNNKRIEVF
jgi:hypothetical protein